MRANEGVTASSVGWQSLALADLCWSCSKTAPLTERSEQTIENWVFFIAFH